MSKRIEELANQYGIKTHLDILELFANEVYGDGVKAGIDKEANTALRDQFAGLAMQGLITNGWNPEGATLYAYEHADAMLKAREVKI